MKTIIAPSKWVMTAALLAVLGLNVSFNSSTLTMTTADFASEVKEAEVIGPKGKFSTAFVQYANGDIKATAPTRDAEGKICTDCARQEYKLESKNLGDLDQLKSELLAAMEKDRATTELAKAPKAAKDTDVKADGDEEEKETVSEGAAILDAKVLEVCEKKSDDSDKLSCFASTFTSVLKRFSKKITDDEAMTFYNDNISELIQDQIKEARHKAVGQFRGLTRRSTSDFDFDEDMDDMDSSDPQDLIDNALDAIKTLHADIPSVREGKEKTRRFDGLRKEVIKTEKEIVSKHAKDVKQAMAAAEANKNSPQYASYLQEASLLNNSLPQTIAALRTSTSEGLQDAINSDYMKSSEARAHLDNYILQSSSLQQNINQFMNDWAKTGKIDATGLDTVPVGVDAAGRQIVIRRGAGVTAADTAGRSSQNLTTTIDGRVYNLVPQNSLVTNDSSAGSVSFGTEWSPVTAANEAARQRMQVLLRGGQ